MNKKPTVTAHAGCCGTEDNSMESLIKAVEVGADILEFDLRFTEAMGHTILDEIHAVRIEKVKEHLLKPGQDASTIPDRCGYNSLADLCRVFKKRTGMTMGEYRKSLS